MSPAQLRRSPSSDAGECPLRERATPIFTKLVSHHRRRRRISSSWARFLTGSRAQPAFAWAISHGGWRASRIDGGSPRGAGLGGSRGVALEERATVRGPAGGRMGVGHPRRTEGEEVRHFWDWVAWARRLGHGGAGRLLWQPDGRCAVGEKDAVRGSEKRRGR
jgi:hypothetical protein